MIVTRLTNDGKLLVNGILDEYTGVPIVDNSTVLWLDVAQASSYAGSGNTWSDLSSPGYNFTLYNTPTYNSRGWFEFNSASSEYAARTHTTALKPAAAITMEQWLNADNWQAGTSGAYLTALSCTQGGGYAHYIWDSTFVPYIYVVALSNYLKPTASVAGFTGWHHFATTFDGRYARLYIDGILASTADAGSNTTISYDPDNDIVIGAEAGTLSTPQGFYWNGKIATTTIYNRALSSDEVAKNYNALAGRFGLTKNSNVSTTQKTTSNAVFSSEFDEVTLNPITNGLARKMYSDGSYHISDQFDEFTGIPVVDGNLKVWLDSAQSTSYSGSGTTWNNLVNSSANATLINTPTFDYLSNGGKFTFDKNTFEYATIPGQGDFNRWSVETWARVTSSLTNQVTSIVTGQFNLATKLNFSIGTNRAPSNYNLCAGFFDGAWRNTTGFDPTLNVWYHLVGTYDGSTINFYVNGVLNSFLNYVGMPQSGGEIRIARRWDDNTTNSVNFFPGDIAVVRIYNRALLSDEIVDNYNAERQRFGI